ncbi:MAG: polar amino acid transport system permease protein [Frankiales bacterium]|jgi:polar amino acid transport system permease protein|nr:polar amino acid transport system permease protein [Frankiales bacterium]
MSEQSGDGAQPLRVVPVRHPGRWASAAVVAVLLAMFVHTLYANERFHWAVVNDYLFNPVILHGLRTTLKLTVFAMAIGFVGGIVVAIMRLSSNPLVSSAAWIYTWVFRGTPLLVQLTFWFYAAALYPRLSLGIPFGPEFTSASSNDLITPLTAALLGLGLNEAAYMAEIVRAGILSVDDGQTEAAQALGMSRLLTLRRIVLPQAMRVIVPPTGNETISMLKTTSLVTVIGYQELLGSAQQIYARNFQTIPLLITISLWYLFLTSVLSIGQFYLERYFARGATRDLPPTPVMRLRGLFGLFGGLLRRGPAGDAA